MMLSIMETVATSTLMPTRMYTMVNSLPPVVLGAMSPYPTCARVVSTQDACQRRGVRRPAIQVF